MRRDEVPGHHLIATGISLPEAKKDNRVLFGSTHVLPLRAAVNDEFSAVVQTAGEPDPANPRPRGQNYRGTGRFLSDCNG